MKLKSDTVMLINLLFRIFLIFYLIKQHEPDKTKNVKPLKYWMDPISKRVFLIFINGLQKDFLKQNSTPYLSEIVEKYGTFGVAMTGYMETNEQGFRTVLTGRYSPPFPYSWLSKNCQESILDYVGYKCTIGRIPQDFPMACYYPDKEPLENFHKFPGLFTAKNHKSSLYIMSLDLDPVWVKDYPSRLKKIDDDLKFFASMVENIFRDNKTTYIVTAARGSPVGRSLSTDAPVVAWGSGISNTEGVTYLWQSDLTAMLCALLGINFPSKLLGIIPTNMMRLQDYYEFQLTLYTIRHFESVLELVDIQDHLIESFELELEQLDNRLDDIITDVRRSKMKRRLFVSSFLILLLLLWGFVLIVFSSSGFAYFFCHLKSLFVLLVTVAITLTYIPLEPELPVLSELILFWICQNCSQIWELVWNHGGVVSEAVAVSIVGVIFVGLFRNLVAIPAILAPVTLWPVISNGTYRRLNRFVLLTRFLSGILVGALPFTRIFGEAPNRIFITSVSFVFLVNFYALLFVFKRDFGCCLKINFLMIVLTNVCVCLPSLNEDTRLRDASSCFLLAFSLLSVWATFGTLLIRLLKVFLPLFIPVLLMSAKMECIFYLSIVFHVFTWIFIEYHSANSLELHPSIFSVQPNNVLRAIQFSNEDLRQVAFFISYCYLSYLAFGNVPELHSYDLYVLPTFFYQYPPIVSYFLGCLRFSLPFFIVTLSFITMCVLKEKDFNQMIMLSLGLSDIIGCCLVFYLDFLNLLFQRALFPAKFSYFMIQQFASASVILSCFMGKHLLLGSGSFLYKIFERKQREQGIC